MQDINMRDISANCSDQFIHPWGVPVGIFGEAWYANTNAGNRVLVWVPHTTNSLCESYFCHGWSTGTYQLHGYTPFSGPPMAQVLNDEWHRVTTPLANDIVVWFGPAGIHRHTPIHSALVVSSSPHGQTWLFSKDGRQMLGGQKALDFVNAAYSRPPHNATEYRFYRRSSGPINLPILPE